MMMSVLRAGSRESWRFSPDLVLDEVLRLEHLADVVEVAADAGQQRIGADGLGARLGQGRHGHAVRVGAGGAADQFLQERMRAVAQFQQADIGDDGEAAFDERQDAADHESRPGCPTPAPTWNR